MSVVILRQCIIHVVITLFQVQKYIGQVLPVLVYQKSPYMTQSNHAFWYQVGQMHLNFNQFEQALFF